MKNREVAGVLRALADTMELLGEDRYLAERRFRELTLAGAGLDDDARARLADLNQRLSVLTITRSIFLSAIFD